jgi:hypothetical protein
MLLTDKTSPIFELIESSRQTEPDPEIRRRNTLGSNHEGSPVIGLAPSARQRRGSLQGQRKSGLPHTSPVQ